MPFSGGVCLSVRRALDEYDPEDMDIGLHGQEAKKHEITHFLAGLVVAAGLLAATAGLEVAASVACRPCMKEPRNQPLLLGCLVRGA